MLKAEIGVGRRSKGRMLICTRRLDAARVSWKGVPKALESRLRKEGEGIGAGRDVRLHPGTGTSFDFVAALDVNPDPEVDEGEWYRRAGARLLQALEAQDVREAHLLRPEDGDFDLTSFAEGFLMAAYAFTEHLSEPPETVRKLVVAPIAKAADQDALARARHVAEAVALTRDLVNRPAADLYPETLASACEELAERHGMTFEGIEGEELEEGFPALHAVGKGSDHLPRFIRVDYRPVGKELPWVVLCGKGITYDSGGYALKVLKSMHVMKKDMGGAAACIGALDLIARLQIPIRVTLLVAAAENMVSGHAFRPGDVIGSRAGKSIEIYSTDAEGRLVLADALAYATELGPDAIVDVATLTGLAKRFFGNVLSPVVGSDPELVEDLVQAGRETHERLISFELLREFREPTEGRISDVKNGGQVGSGGGGTLVAAGFLRRFVDETPWAHLDMSNTSWNESSSDYQILGASAFGVRLLAQFLADRAAPGEEG